MIIWSIQPKPVVQIIESGKSFTCDGRKSPALKFKAESKAFRPSYKWMVEQMKERDIQDNDRYPVWGWYKYHMAEPGRKAPRMRQLKKYLQGEYRIKLFVPDELVLLSGFHEWHNVLMNLFCGSEKYCMRMFTLEENKTWPQSKIDRLKKKSWQKIFDVQDCDYGVQACFPSIEPEYVLKIEQIV